MSHPSGSRLGPFEIVVPLGAGGMGEVYLARDTRIGREVALKVLSTGVAADLQTVARFGREAHLLAQLNHPNIAALYEFDEDGPTRFLVLEYVPGETLAERIRRGRPPVREALETARQMAVALEAAHAGGIIHRDLKPANVKVTPDGRVKLLDFGLAKALEGESSPAAPPDGISAADTHEGLVVGTAAYMSPEQARGLTLDPRTDLWSFGCVLFELLTGRQAFSGSSISDVLASILVREPDWEALPDDTPAGARLLLQSCLHKETARRPADAGLVAAEIEGILSGRSAAAETKALHGSGRPHQRRTFRQAALWALALLAVAALAVAAVTIAYRGRGRPVAERSAPDAKVLAVLPFRDLTGRADGPLVADGLAETVSAQLARAPGVQVLTPLVTAAFRDDADGARLVSQLGATLVLRGSVQRAGELVRVSWLVVAGSGGAPLGGDTQTGPAADLFALQDRVAAGVGSALGLAAATGSAPSGPKGEGVQERYLSALGHLQKYQDAASVDAAITLLEKLSTEEAQWAPVHAALARAYLAKRLLTREPAWADRAREECLKAERIDSSLTRSSADDGAARRGIGRSRGSGGRFPEGACPAARRRRSASRARRRAALRRQTRRGGRGGPARPRGEPSYWVVHNKLGTVLVSSGRVGEAVAAFRRAVELAPENARALVNFGSALVLAGSLEEAAGVLRRSVVVEPTAEALSALGTVEYYRGRFDEAVAGYEKAVALSPGFSTLWVNLGDARRWSPSDRDRAAEAYGRAIGAASEDLRVNPRDVDAHLALASSYAKTGRPAQAAPHIAAALAGARRTPTSCTRRPSARLPPAGFASRPTCLAGRAARGTGMAGRGGPGAARRPRLHRIPREASSMNVRSESPKDAETDSRGRRRRHMRDRHVCTPPRPRPLAAAATACVRHVGDEAGPRERAGAAAGAGSRRPGEGRRARRGRRHSRQGGRANGAEARHRGLLRGAEDHLEKARTQSPGAGLQRG
ncbi:MAG: protein kinase [Holophagales bacterium]|nr:protein kinase [Holophagales bacterium]